MDEIERTTVKKKRSPIYWILQPVLHGFSFFVS
jgi:hypothetical protein